MATITAPLTAFDRCDACSAQAYVLVSVGESTLLFCGHHYAANAAHLTGAVLLDQRSDLTPERA